MITARGAGCSGTLVARADSAFYSAAFTGAVRRAGAFFSVTVPIDPKVKAAIAQIGEGAWTPIKYPRAVWDVGALPLCATARLSLGGLARVQITMFGARSKADWVVKHLLVGRDLVSEPRFSGLDPVRRL